MAGPWEHLEPEPEPPPGTAPAGGSEAAPTVARPARRQARPGALTVFARGLARRCPRCGSGGLFVRRFRVRERCPRCGLRLEREEGGFLGAMALNYGVTAVAWLVLLVAWLVVDLPDLHVAQLTVASIAVAVIVPLAFWPTSKTLWASVDYLVDRTSPDHASREAADRSTGNGGKAS